MKTKHILSAAAVCLLLTGCASNEKGYTPKVNYSDMFVPKTTSTGSPKVTEINGKAAAPVSEDVTDVDEGAANISAASNEDRKVSVSRSANATAGSTAASDSVTTYADNNNEADAGSAAPNENTSSGTTTPNTGTGSDTPSKKVNNPRPASVIFTDAQAVADLQFGDVCYFAYKTPEADITENETGSETTDTSENEDDEEDGDTQKNRYVPPKKYDHGYRVVFRTNTDTYLLGIFPYDQCTWENVNDMCQKIADQIEADCRMVGIPSLEDLQYFTDCGIYLPGQYDMWTSTPASPSKIYYRNKKGAFYSTKSKMDTCGVCAIIKISASQSDPELLSSSLSNYEEAKARLEAEEEQYTLAISGKQEGEQEQE